MSAWKERLRRVVTVELVIFLYMTSTFIVTPAYQQMIITKEQTLGPQPTQELTLEGAFEERALECTNVATLMFVGPDSGTAATSVLRTETVLGGDGWSDHLAGCVKNDTICSNPEHQKGDEKVQTTASYILLLFNTTLILVSIPPALMLGSWSDRAGRRWVMALPSVFSLLSRGLLLAVNLLGNLLAVAESMIFVGGTVSKNSDSRQHSGPTLAATSWWCFILCFG
ncbi:hypothetical protein cypCar_00035819 [Cyprinus carpio]|nr:hypothetical protein cypCar_00035819 [Cyprinus carpio]